MSADGSDVVGRLLYIMLAFFEHFSEAKALSILVAFSRNFFSERLKKKLFFSEKMKTKTQNGKCHPDRAEWRLRTRR